MAYMANCLIKDDAATPNEWTFLPVNDTPVPFWRANAAGIPLEGQPRLTCSAEKLKSGGYKVTAKLEVPVMETLGASGTSAGYVAPPKVAYVTTAIATMFVDRRSTSDDRYNTLKMLTGFLQGAHTASANGDLNQASAGGAFAAKQAPGPQLFGSLIIPN